MRRGERATYALTAGAAAAVGYTLLTDARPRDRLAGLGLLAAADRYAERAAGPVGPSPREDTPWRPGG